jgi:hypothetical protein
VKFVMVSISSRSDGTSNTSTSEKHPRHLLRHLAPEPVALDKIDRRQKARLPEHVGPGIGHLRLQLIHPTAECQFFKGSRALRRTESHSENRTASREG